MSEREIEAGSPFATSYVSSRDRFRSSAEALGATLEAYSIGQTGPSGEDLTIDAARFGPERAERLLIVSSGLHGVEGYFGAAVQRTWMAGGQSRVRPESSADAVLLVHALDPFGFAWVRRFDERNVDLNRNFLPDGDEYAGSPLRYAALDGLINPRKGLRPLDDLYYRVRTLLAVLRYGMADLKAAVVGGQYDYPFGLFFGGHGPSRVHEILEENLPRWASGARTALHVDFHTGLGPWATYRLLLDLNLEPERVAWVRERFGATRVEAFDPNGISYPVRGELGQWCRSRLAALGCDYRMLCAEFGTYSGVRVVAALRAENRAHHWLPEGHPARVRTKARLLEAFVPADAGWRATTVAQGVELLDKAREVAFGG